MATFQSLWVGDPPSPYQHLAMKSFIDHGHHYHLYSYQAFDLPQGVERRDAGAILPEAAVFRHGRGMGHGSFGGFSDLFRYRLLLARGGWWVDTDVICLSAAIPEPEIVFGWQDDRIINGAILRFPAGHPTVDALCRAAEAAGQAFAWGAIGPGLLTATIQNSDIERHAVPAARAYPIRWPEALDLLLPGKAAEVRAKVGGAPLLHLWHEITRQAGVLQWAGPPDGSVVADLFARHGIPVRQPAYSADEMGRLARNLAAAINAGRAETEVKRLQAELDAIRTRRDDGPARSPRP